ncbi:MAG TPA: thermonuclease family protein [Rhizomicrobium sp.]
MRIVIFFLALAMASPAMALPECAGPTEVPHAHIVRVERNGVLVLSDGRAAHLEGIRLPQGAADNAPQYFADDAMKALASMALVGDLNLTAIPPKEDRYDRIRVQAFGAAGWLQVELLRQGLARVEIAPDRSECAAELYAAEAQARTRHLGLWSSPAYAVRSAAAMNAAAGTFQIVEGRVLSVTIHDGRAYLDFGTDYKRDFSATISPEDKKTFTAMGVNPRDYEGRRIRLRGIVQDDNGPQIELSNPMQVELLP